MRCRTKGAETIDIVTITVGGAEYMVHRYPKQWIVYKILGRVQDGTSVELVTDADTKEPIIRAAETAIAIERLTS